MQVCNVIIVVIIIINAVSLFVVDLHGCNPRRCEMKGIN